MATRNWKQMEAIEEKQEATLFDLSPEDIMMTHVAQYLKMEDLKNLRLCSRKCMDLADVMFAGIRTFSSFGHGSEIEKFLKKTRRLRILNISGKYYTDEIVHDVLSNNCLLNTVGIKYCPNITSLGLKPLAEYCKDICHLALENKDSASQVALQAFFEKQIIIENVNLYHTIDLSPIISTIANFCPNLKELNIENCVLNNGKVLIELASKCLKLDSLDVSSVAPPICQEVLNELLLNQRPSQRIFYENYDNYCDDGGESAEFWNNSSF